MRNPCITPVFCSIFLLLSSVASADWSHRVSPSIWLAGLDGELSIPGGSGLDLEADFGDMFDGTDTGVSLEYTGRVSDKVVRLGLTSVDMGASQILSDGSMAGADLDVTMWSVMAGLTIQEGDDPIDFMLGLRSVDTDLDFGGVLNGSASASWVDPVFGLQMDMDIGDGIELALYADVGGFGAGSDITWQVMPSARIHFSEACSGVLTYRALAIESKEDEAFLSDIMIRGWMIGFGYSY